MRGHKRLFGALVALMATIAMVCSVAGPAYAEPYGYTIRVFQGNGGKLKSDPVSVPVEKGGRVNLFDFAEADTSDSKYVQIGFRLSGEDEIIGNGVINGVIEHGRSAGDKYGSGITQDMDFVVAYGVQGETVKYTLKFVEYGTGRQLADPQTYYGRIGDKPVVAYEYIEGYRPLYLSITGTLKENEEENVWTFEYVALQEGETVTPGTTTTNTTTTNTPGNETVNNETTYEPGTTTTTTRTETVPGTTTTEPATSTGTTTAPATTTTTAPTTTGGTTTTAPSGTTTTTTTVVPTTTTSPASVGGDAATASPVTMGGGDAPAAPAGVGDADATTTDAAGATAGGGDEGTAALEPEEPAPATREILDMDTPLAGPDSGSDAGPVGNAASSVHANSNAGIGILFALLVAAALVAGYYVWKRKQEDSEDEPESEE